MRDILVERRHYSLRGLWRDRRGKLRYRREAEGRLQLWVSPGQQMVHRCRECIQVGTGLQFAEVLFGGRITDRPYLSAASSRR